MAYIAYRAIDKLREVLQEQTYLRLAPKATVAPALFQPGIPFVPQAAPAAGKGQKTVEICYRGVRSTVERPQPQSAYYEEDGADTPTCYYRGVPYKPQLPPPPIDLSNAFDDPPEPTHYYRGIPDNPPNPGS